MGGEREDVGGLLCGVPLGGEFHDFPLPLGEDFPKIELIAGVDPAKIPPEQCFGRGGIEKDFTPGDGPDGIEQVGVGARFADIAGAACFQDRQQVALFGMDGEHENAGRQLERGDLANRLQPTAWHREIGHHDRRHVFSGEGEGRRTILRFGDDTHVGLCFEQDPQPGADYPVIIGK